jgi:hypothetical protein
MSSEPESFLARWSRRKRAVDREAEPSVEDAAPPIADALPAQVGGKGVVGGEPVPAPALNKVEGGDTGEVELPPIESLEGLRSDYTAFFQQPVGEDLRRAALRKLFADPHFNQMDMLDVYVDDYTQFEPLPAALRMRLPSARAFLHGSELAEVEAAEAAAAAVDDESKSLAAAASAEQDHAVSPEAVEDPNVESTAAPGEVPADTSPAQAASAAAPDNADNVLNVSSSTAIAPGKTAAPDPSLT